MSTIVFDTIVFDTIVFLSVFLRNTSQANFPAGSRSTCYCKSGYNSGCFGKAKIKAKIKVKTIQNRAKENDSDFVFHETIGKFFKNDKDEKEG
jgi:hypothetical protein